MSMQCNSVVRLIDHPISNTSRSPTTSENPSTVGLPTRHHQRHAKRLHETRNPGVMRQSRVRVRRSVSSAAGLVEGCILPDSAHHQMIAETWMNLEQSRPVMPTATYLAWIWAMIPPRPSSQRPNGSQYVPSTPGGDFQVAERTSSTKGSDGFESRQALEAI